MMCSGLQAGDEKAVLSTKKCKRKLTRHNNYQCLGHFYFILFQSRVKASFQWTRQVHMKTQRQTRWISTDIHRRCCFHRLRSYSVGVSCGSCQRVDFSVLISACWFQRQLFFCPICEAVDVSVTIALCSQFATMHTKNYLGKVLILQERKVIIIVYVTSIIRDVK